MSIARNIFQKMLLLVLCPFCIWILVARVARTGSDNNSTRNFRLPRSWEDDMVDQLVPEKKTAEATTEGRHKIRGSSDDDDTIEGRIGRVRAFCKSMQTVDMIHKRQKVQHQWVHSHIRADSNDTKTTDLQWCPVFKAASSTWLATILKLANRLTPAMQVPTYDAEKNLMDVARLFGMVSTRDTTLNQLTPLQFLNISHELKLSILIVRHPFERLLSAYRDKLEQRKRRGYYHRKFGRYIVRHFRHGNTTIDGTGQLTAAMTNGTNPLSPDTPTFGEFVKFLLFQPPALMDEHWRPTYIDCSVCSTNFNLIFKVETMDRDRNYLLTLVGVPHAMREALKKVWEAWTNDTHYTRRAKTTAEYFAEVPQEDLVKLYKLYKPDFAAFKYDVEPYLRHNDSLES